MCLDEQSSFFIPLEQGLKHLTHLFVVDATNMFFLHSIRTRIKTYFCSKLTLSVCSFFIPLEQGLKLRCRSCSGSATLFFLHSIRTRIKTRGLAQLLLALIGSFFIPLEQGLKQFTSALSRWLLSVLSSFH